MSTDYSKYDKTRKEPLPTQTIEIHIAVVVRKRDDYQEHINNIVTYVRDIFPELKTDNMNSPLQVRIKIR